MQRVSTNLTLFYKFFIPTFWIVLFGSVTAMVFISPSPAYGDIPGGRFRLGLLLFFLSGVLMLFFTLMRLKRVEMDDLYVYVTNYFKTFRYPYHNIEQIQESKFFFLRLVTISLKEKGFFGQKITFVASNRLYQRFWDSQPELHKKLFAEEED